MTAIVIVTYNIQDQVFLLQMEAVQKFCKDPFTIQIIDNSTDISKAESIRYHAERLGISYRRTKANTADSSWSHSFAANTALRILEQNKYKHSLFLDHDCIPVKPFSVPDILAGKFMAGLAQNKSHTYFWPGCFMWDTKRVDQALIDFSPNGELQLDTGGQLRLLIDKYGRENCYFFDEIICNNPAYTGKQYSFYNMLCNETFIHFVNASNWNPVDDNAERLNSLINITREMIEKA